MTPSVQGAFPACHLLLTHQACLHAVVVAGSIVRQIYRLRVRAMLTRVSGRERRGRPAQAARQAAGAAPRPRGALRRRPPLHLVRHCRHAPCRCLHDLHACACKQGRARGRPSIKMRTCWAACSKGPSGSSGCLCRVRRSCFRCSCMASVYTVVLATFLAGLWQVLGGHPAATEPA